MNCATHGTNRNLTMYAKNTAMLMAAAALLGGCMPYRTDSTEVGVRMVKWSPMGNAGVEEKVYEPGTTHFFVPFLTDWYTFDTRVQNLEMTASEARGDREGRDDLLLKTIDGNDISLDVIITWRIVPEEAPRILKEVATSNDELKANIVRTITRSKPRDIFGELNTEDFYVAETRTAKAEEVKLKLNEILEPYGVVVDRVSPRDYRFNPAYQQAIEDKKIADQQAEKLKSEVEAVREEYNTKVEEAKAEVEKVRAAADGEYERAKIEADAYYEQQVNIAKAIEAEAQAEAEAIRSLNAALAGSGGPNVVKLAIAEALKDKRIVMIPAGGNALDVRSTDLNEILRAYGLFKAAQPAK